MLYIHAIHACSAPPAQSLELCLSSLPSCDALAHLPALRHLRITADGRHPHSRRHAQDGGGAPPQGAAAGAGAAGPAGRSGWDWGVAPLPRGLRSLGIDVHGESERLRASGTAWLAAATSLTALWARGCWLAAPRAAEHLLALTQLEALDLTVPTDPFAGTSRPAITARDRLLAASAALPRLRRLRLAVSVDLGTSGLVGDVFIQNFSLLSALPRLEHLSLGRSGLAGHALAHPEACRVSGLTSLELRAGLHDRAGDDRLAQLLEGLPWLRKLRITGPSAQAGADAGPQFSGAGLAPLADRAARAGGDGGRGGGGSSCGCLGRGGVQNDNRGAAAVTSVVIRRCFCFGAPGARQIARLSASLLRLDLSGCSAVDDGCFGPLGDLTRLTSEREREGLQGASRPCSACGHTCSAANNAHNSCLGCHEPCAPSILHQASTSPAACVSATPPSPPYARGSGASRRSARPAARASRTAAPRGCRSWQRRCCSCGWGRCRPSQMRASRASGAWRASRRSRSRTRGA